MCFGVDEVDAPSSRPDFDLLVYPAYLEKDRRVAPELNLKASIPPTLIISTEDDETFVRGCKLYHAALERRRPLGLGEGTDARRRDRRGTHRRS